MVVVLVINANTERRPGPDRRDHLGLQLKPQKVDSGSLFLVLSSDIFVGDREDRFEFVGAEPDPVLDAD